MTMRATQGINALTEKEKQTLRLIVRGHDAKSIARNLDLSVHTINERLRDARRKLTVSSSREAARLLFDAEGEPPNPSGDTKIGEAVTAPDVEQDGDAGRMSRLGRSEEHTSELQSLMRISYAVFCLNKKTNQNNSI